MNLEGQISALVARYGVPRGLARLAVDRGLHARCAALADRDPDPRAGFIAAVNALVTVRQQRLNPSNPSAEALTTTRSSTCTQS